MKSNTLPLIESPPIVTYQHHAFYLGILFTDKKSLPWFVSNYINLIYDRREKLKINFVLGEEYFDMDCFTYNKIGYDLSLDIFNSNELTEIIKRMIDGGYYVLGAFDEFFVPNRFASGKYHHAHDFLLYGYDDDDMSFQIIGYTDKNTYKKGQLPFNELKSALYSVRPNWVNFFKIKEDYDFIFDSHQVKKLLFDYLHSKASYGHDPCDACSFGINATLDFVNELDDNLNLFDLRYFRLFWEHKKCMISRLEYLHENRYLPDNSVINDYLEVVNNFELVLRMAIKVSIKFSMAKRNKSKGKMQSSQGKLFKAKDAVALESGTLSELKSIILDAVYKEKNILEKVIEYL